VPRTVDDAYLMAESLKDRKAAQEQIRKEAIKQLRLSFKADNVDESEKYMRRAQIHIEAGNFTPAEARQLLKQASQGYESMIDNVAERFARTSEKRLQDLLRKGE